ncbi:MAG TPA: hypothetical protein VN673_01870, partial [Clostridia bacterium]|nr:hypothetical protein [Clostridia bacterium]
MQISKLLLAVCAVTAGAVALPVQGADTEAQAKAREALRQKMNETAPAAQPAPVAPQTPVAPKAPKAPVVPVAEPAPAAPVLNAVPVAADPEAVAKAREAVRQKMLELDRQQQAV